MIDSDLTARRRVGGMETILSIYGTIFNWFAVIGLGLVAVYVARDLWRNRGREVRSHDTATRYLDSARL